MEQPFISHLSDDEIASERKKARELRSSQCWKNLKGEGDMLLLQRKNFNGMNFWARGYFVSTVGADEEVVRAYIQTQEKEDKRLEQLTMFQKG